MQSSVSFVFIPEHTQKNYLGQDQIIFFRRKNFVDAGRALFVYIQQCFHLNVGLHSEVSS
jgi:hypothetical protein